MICLFTAGTQDKQAAGGLFMNSFSQREAYSVSNPHSESQCEKVLMQCLTKLLNCCYYEYSAKMLSSELLKAAKANFTLDVVSRDIYRVYRLKTRVCVIALGKRGKTKTLNYKIIFCQLHC